MVLNNLAEITGDAAAHALTTGSEKGKYVIIQTPSANGADVRIGGASVSSSVGLPVPKGTTIILPPVSDPMEVYPLAGLYYYAGSGDKLNVMYATEGSNI